MHPILFEIPGLDWPIFSYGVMLGLSLVVGWYFTLFLAHRDGFSREVMANVVLVSMVSALVGARLLYAIVNPDQIQNAGDLLNVRQGGLVAYGGFLGGLGASWLYCRWKKVRLLAYADVAVPSLATGLLITRMGCFLYGCDYGRRITDDDPGWLRALAVRFPNWAERFPSLSGGGGGACQSEINGAPAFAHHVADYGLDSTAVESFAVVPTQLISSVNGLVALAIVLIVRRYRTFRGQVFLSFGIYYGLSRFLIETIRDDTQRGTLGPAFLGPIGGFEGHLTSSQLIAFLTISASIAGWIYLARKAKNDPEAAMSIGEGAAPPEKEETDRPKGKSRRRPKKRKGK